jgi:UDP-N-acetyl-D-mannosaminuronic acid dehydrogenase
VVAAYGLAFKPNIDDLRESPAVEIVRDLATTFPQATVLAVEPNIDELPAELAALPNVRLVGADEALTDADAHLLLVDHTVFRPVAGRLAEKNVIDTRGMTAGRNR